MRCLLALIVTCSFAINAHASKFECNFTEPFILLKVDTTARIVHVNDVNAEPQRSQAQIGSINETRRFITLSYGADKILMIDKSIKGNDGMSDNVYDFVGSLRTVGDNNNVLFGGCNRANRTR
jgi:uncharacterized membrane protein